MSTLLRLAGSMIYGPLVGGSKLWGESEIGFGAGVGLIVGEAKWRLDRVRSFNWFRKSHDRDKLQRVLSPVLILISTQTRDSRVHARSLRCYHCPRLRFYGTVTQKTEETPRNLTRVDHST